MDTRRGSSNPENPQQAVPPIDLVDADFEIRPLFVRYRDAYVERERAGLELGRCLLKWRDQYAAQGRAEEGLKALLKRVKIPRSTAYRLMQGADPNFVSSEAKFDVRRILAGLCRWSKKVPNGLKDCSDETLDQLKDVQAELKAAQSRINKLISDAEHIRRTKSSTCAGLPLSDRLAPIKVNIRAGERSIAARVDLASARWEKQRIAQGEEANEEEQYEPQP